MVIVYMASTPKAKLNIYSIVTSKYKLIKVKMSSSVPLSH